MGSLAFADVRPTNTRWTGLWNDPKAAEPSSSMGRVVVEAETADAAREKAEPRGYLVLEVYRDASNQAVSF